MLNAPHKVVPRNIAPSRADRGYCVCPGTQHLPSPWMGEGGVSSPRQEGRGFTPLVIPSRGTGMMPACDVG
jgi:hypothetical protein